MIGQEHSCYPLNQSDAKLTPISTWWLAFSRSSGSLHVFASSTHWLLFAIVSLILIGSSSYFGLDLRRSIEKRSNRVGDCYSYTKTHSEEYSTKNAWFSQEINIQILTGVKRSMCSWWLLPGWSPVSSDHEIIHKDWPSSKCNLLSRGSSLGDRRRGPKCLEGEFGFGPLCCGIIKTLKIRRT